MAKSTTGDSNELAAALQLPVTALPGVGSKVALALAELGIERVFDLLMHLPKGYEDRSRIWPLRQATAGQTAMFFGNVVQVDRAKQGLMVTLQDNSGQIKLRFFKNYPSLLKAMQIGNALQVFGEVKQTSFGLQLHHPEYHQCNLAAPKTPHILALYPTVKGLHQNKLRTLIKTALASLPQDPWPGLQPQDLADISLMTDMPAQANIKQPDLTVPPLLQASALAQLEQWTIGNALTFIHLPPTYTCPKQQTNLLNALIERTHPSCHRLILEELVAHQLTVLSRRQQFKQHPAPRCVEDSPTAKRLLDALPYKPTCAQAKVSAQVIADLCAPKPMLRLVQGDVGAGKTLVAAWAACHAIDSGWQVAVMAPTEILAEQHLASFSEWFAPLGIQVGWLVGKQTSKARQKALDAIANNDLQIVVGTHALFQEEVVFAKLGLVIIDEQHRFGVEQRLALTQKGVAGTTPHQLVMTATPIPRTFAMTAYGDMDTSVIDALPPGRTPVTTVVMPRTRRDAVIERIAVNCSQGKQAYWVCPLVEESTALNAQAAEATYADLQTRLSLKIGMVHGRLKPLQKQQIMQQFKKGELDLLVATTVIEVGVDVPKASLMVIENAERLGLSQLHQLRGRVGRGSTQSFCVLLYQPPLSETGQARLEVLKNSNDGFVIAQTDLEIRGPGELLGKRQTGNFGYYVSDLIRDDALLALAQQLAAFLLEQPKRQTDIGILMQRWIPKAGRFMSA